MRIATFIITLAAASLFAASTIPSVEQSAAVFTGRVIKIEKVKAITAHDCDKWELWKAEVRVQTVGSDPAVS